MIRRVLNRLRATFTGPSARDALSASEALAAEVAALRADLDRLRPLAEPFHTRPGTFDPHIYADVLVNNEYRLPARFDAADAVMDIGAHVGSFAAACLLRGAGRVLSFEPFPDNFALATVNLARFGPRAEVRRAAVWRSDRPAGTVSFTDSPDPPNTGGGHLMGRPGAGTAVPSVPLDGVVRDFLAAAGQARLRLLKLDCEGSEYPILLTATCLHLVDEICGEYHEVGAVGPELAAAGHAHFSRELLVGYLEAAGFAVESEVHPKNALVGLFWARRR